MTAESTTAGLSTAASRASAREATAFLSVLVFAFVLRVALGLSFPNTAHPDEVFQVSEQAYRLISGRGIIPWEFREGVRGWLWPGVIAGVLYPVERTFGSASANLAAIVAFCSLLSLIPIASAYWLGRQISRTHAVLAAFVVAIWFECVYFAVHPLTEVVAGDFLVPALCLMSVRPTAKRAFAAGAFLALAFVMRFHLAPALALAAAWYARGNVRERWLPLLLGALVPMTIYGIVDWATLGWPFRSIYENFRANIVLDRSSHYGVLPIYAFGRMILLEWTGAVAIIGGLAIVGARRFPMWLAVAAIILITHSLVGHKEYRFVYPAVLMLVVLAGIGTGDAVELAKAAIKRSELRRLVAPGAAAAWFITSFSLATSDGFAKDWFGWRPQMEATSSAAKISDMCGLGLDLAWASTSGYFGLHRPVAVFDASNASAPWAPGYNVLMAPEGVTPPAPFVRLRCFTTLHQPGVCLFKRPGNCVPHPEAAINLWLRQHGQ